MEAIIAHIPIAFSATIPIIRVSATLITVYIHIRRPQFMVLRALKVFYLIARQVNAVGTNCPRAMTLFLTIIEFLFG